MLIKDQTASVRPIETAEDLAETRLEAVGYVFHGVLPQNNGKRTGRAGTNLLHFARCPKLDKVGEREAKIWFRTIRIAKQHLDATVGVNRWKWCKICEREITQKILNEQ
ncbi:MAG: hypothetical protein IRY99_06275 [Isosphaeraceae bacterium]|nr:hypothetical protein [Isosphaeraceae bacterium]